MDVDRFGTDFSAWQSGGHATFRFGETDAVLLGTDEGAREAVEFLGDGVDTVVRAVRQANDEQRASLVYLYTAHPDKHMHALGTDHPQVRTVIQGINHHLERMCNNLAGLEATIVVTADHGHITVQPEDMVVLPENIVECLDYANVGVYGKVRYHMNFSLNVRHAAFSLLGERVDTPIFIASAGCRQLFENDGDRMRHSTLHLSC